MLIEKCTWSTVPWLFYARRRACPALLLFLSRPGAHLRKRQQLVSILGATGHEEPPLLEPTTRFPAPLTGSLGRSLATQVLVGSVSCMQSSTGAFSKFRILVASTATTTTILPATLRHCRLLVSNTRLTTFDYSANAHLPRLQQLSYDIYTFRSFHRYCDTLA